MPNLPTPSYRLIIFDMDGTLTEELLDFDAIRRDLAVPQNVGILEHLSHLAGREWITAQDILNAHEMAAALTCKLHPGATELLQNLTTKNIKTALLTRNSLACATTILTRHQLKLDHISTRENRPHKPHADSILNITRHFGISPEQTLMVGDYLYDLQAAQAAGVDAALLHMDDGPPPDVASLARYTLRHLADVLTLV